jgi:SAM-dependent methyltransferase
MTAVTSDDDQPPADAALGAYLLAEPFVAGRVVLDVGPRPARASSRLTRAGAREVLAEEGPGSELPQGDASVDVVLCVARMGAMASDADRHRWLLELRRVLRPGGFCLLRVPVAALERAEESAESVLRELLRHHFSVFDVVAEATLTGVAYLAPDTDEVAVNEELASITAPPTHLVALCAAEGPRPWNLPESLLVPLRSGRPTGAVREGPEEVAALRAELDGVRARHQEAVRDRDTLREALMSLQDRLDQQEDALTSLRRQAARHLKSLSEGATALELAGVEKRKLERRLTGLEKLVLPTSPATAREEKG